MQYDPVTGAPLPARRSGHPYPVYPVPQYLTANPYPYPYPYQYPGYIPAQVLTPSPRRRIIDLPPSPTLHPVDWVQSYNQLYGASPSPRRAHLVLEPETAPPPGVYVPSAHVSPYYGLVPLPAAPGEVYENTQETWAKRFFRWVNGESELESHRHFFQPILIHEALDRKKSGIKWNVANPPHTIYMNNPPSPNASAFEPPLQSVKIVCPLLPWIIEIKAHSPHTYITVLSLLADMHKMLSKAIDMDMYSTLPESFRQQVNEAFRKRVWSIPDGDAATLAHNRGIKRVDFLLDKNFYYGLHQQKQLINTFELKLSTE